MNNNPRTIIRVSIFLALLWGGASYFVAGGYYRSRIAEMVAQETKNAQKGTDDLADSIRRNLHYLGGIPDMLTHLIRVNAAVSRFGSADKPSALPYAVKKQRWTADPAYNDLSRYLTIAQASLGADLIYVVNAAGDSIAASNWDTPGTTIGTNYAERDFFKQNRAGHVGMQYAIGKTTHIAGLYFSSPVIINGKFMGAVVAKADVPNLSFLTKLTDAFVTDKNGVIILAHDPPMEMQVLADGALHKLSQQDVINYYQRSDFQTLKMAPWEKDELAGVMRIDGETNPHILAISELPEYGLTVHIENELPGLLILEQERIWVPLWISIIGCWLIALGGIAAYYFWYIRRIRQELRNDRENLGDVLHASMDAIISIDAMQKITYFNKAAEQMFGYPASYAMGQPLDSLIPPQFRAVHEQHIESFGKTGETARSMCKIGMVFGLRANGEEFPVEASISQSAVGGKKYYTVILRDITQRKQTEQKLLESENKFHLLFESANDGMMLLSMDGHILDVNRLCHERLGYTKEEMVGRRIAEFDQPEYAPIVPQRMVSIKDTGFASFESAHLRRDGTVVPVEINAKKIELGGQEMVLSVIRDITERKEIAKKLRSNEAQYRAVIETSVDGFWVVGEQGRLLEVNTAYERQSGYSREELLAMRVPDLEATESSNETAAHIDKIMRDGHDRFETLHRRKDGSVWPVEIATTFWREGGHIFAFFSDITERKRAEEALKSREERLQSLFDQASEGILLVSPGGKLIAANESFARMHGYTPQEMQVMELKDLDTPEGVRMIHERMRRITSGEPLTFEVENYHKDGHLFPIEVSASMVVIDGEPLIQSFVRDISERKANETKIQFLTRIYATQSQVNHALIKSEDETELFNRTCQIIVEFGGMKLAWIGVNDRRSGLIKPAAVYGSQTDYLDNIVISSRADVPEGSGPTGVAFRERRSIFIQDFGNDPMLAVWRGRIEKYGWGSSAAVPIIRGGAAYAVMTFYDTEKQVFTGEIIGLFNEIAIRIGGGLDRLDLKAGKLKAEESMQLAAAIYEASSEAVMVTDEENFIVDINPAFTRITGYAPEDILGRNPRVMQSGKHDKEFYRAMWLAIKNEGGWQGEIWDRRKDGGVYAKWATISVIRNPDGSVFRHVAQFSDITEKKQQDELIQRQASYDMLTGLPNRRLFQDRLEQEIKRADSNRAGSPLALLYLDLDRFKEINDTLGHAMGDILLVEAARRISACVRETDTVARLGGDEFSVILPEMGDRSQLERIATCIIDALSDPFDLGDERMGYVSASIGITLYPDDARDIESLSKNADQAMYVAKAAGRGRFGYFTESMQQGAREKLALTNDLRHALARNELHVYYQPILDLGSGQITKAEALLRWKHPVRGMVGPALFIPLAEESGLIYEIGEWVFRQAVAQVAQWRKLYGRIIQVSVNKSPAQFEHPERSDWLEQMIKLDLPGNGITVEITEGLLLKESSKAKQRLLEFRNNGIEVSIDDFGTGFSSLSYLKQFDIDYLKIDRSFVKDLEVNRDDMALTEAIIVMAHKLGIKTIAEGVETEAQRDLLKSFGCDYVQGFLYSPAVPVEEFGKMLENKD